MCVCVCVCVTHTYTHYVSDYAGRCICACVCAHGRVNMLVQCLRICVYSTKICFHVRDTTHGAAWRIHMCDMTHWQLDACLCVTWLIDSVTNSHVWHDPFNETTVLTVYLSLSHTIYTYPNHKNTFSPVDTPYKHLYVFSSLFSHSWMSPEMNDSCHVHVCTGLLIRTSHITHANESCHTCKWVISHMRMSHATRTNESCRIYEWVMANEPVFPHRSTVMHKLMKSHVTHTNESRVRHGTHANVSCRTCVWMHISAITQQLLNESCHSYE